MVIHTYMIYMTYYIQVSSFDLQIGAHLDPLFEHFRIWKRSLILKNLGIFLIWLYQSLLVMIVKWAIKDLFTSLAQVERSLRSLQMWTTIGAALKGYHGGGYLKKGIPNKGELRNLDTAQGNLRFQHCQLWNMMKHLHVDYVSPSEIRFNNKVKFSVVSIFCDAAKLREDPWRVF